MAAMAEPGLQNQGGREQQERRAAGERAAYNQPVPARMNFRSHRASDGV
jgi:hypothetical protein